MDVRVGSAIRWNGELYLVLDAKHIHKGRGGATVSVKLKHLETGQVRDTSLRDSDNVEEVFLERKTAQYSYKDGAIYHFYETTTYEDLEFTETQLADIIPYLKEGTEVTILYVDGKPVGVEPPTFVELQVVETPPGVKGDTASGGSKPAKLETGITITVPLFIEVGDVVRVDTRTNRYIERVRS